MKQKCFLIKKMQSNQYDKLSPFAQCFITQSVHVSSTILLTFWSKKLKVYWPRDNFLKDALVSITRNTVCFQILVTFLNDDVSNDDVANVSHA